MNCFCNIIKCEVRDGDILAQVKYNDTVYNDVIVASLLPIQSLPRNNIFGLFIPLEGGNQMVFPLETHLKFLPKKQGEFLFGDIQTNSFLQYADNKVNLQAGNVKLLKVIESLMMLILTNFQSVQQGFNSLSGVIVPPQSPAPQALTVASQMSNVANNLTTKNNEINDKITIFGKTLIQ